MIGTVTAVGRARSGKVVVKIDNQDYFPGKDADLTGLNVGDRIDFDARSWVYRDKTYWGFDLWRRLEGAKASPAPVVSIQPQAAIVAPATPQTAQPPEVPQLSRDEQIFCQAILKSAIETGLIKTPEEMAPWVQKVRDICRFFA